MRDDKTEDEQTTKLRAPFPWYGGKSRVADVIWQRFGGDVSNYVEPFFGSGAVLLGRPGNKFGTEMINDKDAFVANFWRAVKHDPQAVAEAADWPSNESDLTARHAWLAPKRAELTRRLEGDPDFYDAKIAGWWCWGISAWIGNGWCTNDGPWRVIDGQLFNATKLGLRGACGIQRSRPNSVRHGVLSAWCKSNVNEVFTALCKRLGNVIILAGDWSRAVSKESLRFGTHVAVLLDPPYEMSRSRVYAEDSSTIYAKVARWARDNGNNERLRIALCGYEGSFTKPDGWSEYAWSTGECDRRIDTQGARNRSRERIWFSPHCLKP